MEEKLEDISLQLYNLNQTLQNFIMVFCEVFNKPLEKLDDDGFKFENEK